MYCIYLLLYTFIVYTYFFRLLILLKLSYNITGKNDKIYKNRAYFKVHVVFFSL